MSRMSDGGSNLRNKFDDNSNIYLMFYEHPVFLIMTISYNNKMFYEHLIFQIIWMICPI